MAVNKVVYVENGVQKTLVDLTADTVTAETLKKGTIAHDKTGAQVTGTMESSESGSSMKAVTIGITVKNTENCGFFSVMYTDENGEFQEYSTDPLSDKKIELQMMYDSMFMIWSDTEYTFDSKRSGQMEQSILASLPSTTCPMGCDTNGSGKFDSYVNVFATGQFWETYDDHNPADLIIDFG